MTGRNVADGGSGGPEISVVIPHYNDLPALDRCLASVAAQSFPHERTEVIVCDNASLPVEQIERLIAGRARLVLEPVKGAGPARNRGAAAAHGPVLAFIDSDCIADSRWVEEGLKALDTADLVGGRVKVFSDAARPTGADIFEQIFAFDFRSYIEDKGFTGAGNLFVTRDVFEKVGGFSNGVSEDLEWSRRAVAKGFRLRYAHDAVVSHPTRPDWPSLRAKWKRMVREEFLTRRQAGRGRASWLARQVLVAASPLVHSAKIMRTDFSTPEKARAIGALWRLRWWRVGEAVRLARENPRAEAVPRGRERI